MKRFELYEELEILRELYSEDKLTKSEIERMEEIGILLEKKVKLLEKEFEKSLKNKLF